MARPGSLSKSKQDREETEPCGKRYAKRHPPCGGCRYFLRGPPVDEQAGKNCEPQSQKRRARPVRSDNPRDVRHERPQAGQNRHRPQPRRHVPAGRAFGSGQPPPQSAEKTENERCVAPSDSERREPPFGRSEPDGEDTGQLRQKTGQAEPAGQWGYLAHRANNAASAQSLPKPHPCRSPCPSLGRGCHRGRSS